MLGNGGPFVILTVCFLYSLAAPGPQNLLPRLFGADKLGLESAKPGQPTLNTYRV